MPILERAAVPYRLAVGSCLARSTRRGRARQLARAIRRAARKAGADLVVVDRRPGARCHGAGRLIRRRVNVFVVPADVPPPSQGSGVRAAETNLATTGQAPAGRAP